MTTFSETIYLYPLKMQQKSSLRPYSSLLWQTTFKPTWRFVFIFFHHNVHWSVSERGCLFYREGKTQCKSLPTSQECFIMFSVIYFLSYIQHLWLFWQVHSLWLPRICCFLVHFFLITLNVMPSINKLHKCPSYECVWILPKYN